MKTFKIFSFKSLTIFRTFQNSNFHSIQNKEIFELPDEPASRNLAIHHLCRAASASPSTAAAVTKAVAMTSTRRSASTMHRRGMSCESTPFRASLADPAKSPDPQNNRQNAGRRGKSRPNRPRKRGRPAKFFEGRGKISAPTREYAGFRLAPTVPRIAVKRLAGGTFQPAPFPHLLLPLPAIGSARPPPAIPAISADGITPPGRPSPGST